MSGRRCVRDDTLCMRDAIRKEIIMNRCFDCKFFIRHNFTEYSFPAMGHCRKKSPVVVFHSGETQFPETPETGFCGEFESAGPFDIACTGCNAVFRAKDAIVAGDRMLFCPKCESKAKQMDQPHIVEVFCDDCETRSIISGPGLLDDPQWCNKCKATSPQHISLENNPS